MILLPEHADRIGHRSSQTVNSNTHILKSQFTAIIATSTYTIPDDYNPYHPCTKCIGNTVPIESSPYYINSTAIFGKSYAAIKLCTYMVINW